MIISRTAGMERRSIALLSLTSVKSCSVPVTASLMSLRIDLVFMFSVSFKTRNDSFLYPEIIKTTLIRYKTCLLKI